MAENRFVSTCVLLLLALSSAAPAFAQGRILLLRGELVADSRTFIRMNDFQVEVVSNGDHMGGQRTQVRADGTFLIRDAVPGPSRLRVLDTRGEQVIEQYINVQEGIVLSIRLPESTVARPPAGKVSVRELAHATPRNAIKEYLNAKKAMAAGNPDKSIAHFERAVQVHPRFMEAWNDLGVAYVQQKRFPEAAEAFRKAAALDPDSTIVSQNLRVAEYWAGRASQPSKPF